MTPAAALLAEAKAAGITVEPAGAYIRIRPADACPEGLKARLREHKAEVLALLRPEPTGTTAPVPEVPESPETLPGVRCWVYPWPVSLPGLGGYRIDHFDMCSDCLCGTWSRYGGRPLCFACASRRARP